MVQAESSASAARNGLQPNTAGAPQDYELPWWVDPICRRNLEKPDWPKILSRVEKYRPIFLDDIVGNTETIERLKIIAKDGNMPHVIISGMPGIGKTTSVLCLARQLLGDSYKEAVLELNASDERGEIAVWQGLFCETMSSDRFIQVSMSCEIESKDLHKRKSRSLLVVISLLFLMKQTGMIKRTLFTLDR